MNSFPRVRLFRAAFVILCVDYIPSVNVQLVLHVVLNSAAAIARSLCGVHLFVCLSPETDVSGRAYRVAHLGHTGLLN